MSADFTTIRTVGGMLPSDLLGRVVAGDKDLGGLTPSDYDLPNETPREAANRVWSYLLGVWTTYKTSLARLPAGDPALGLTREKWLLVLFDQLGYGRLATTPAGGLRVADRAFPVSHRWGQVPLHLLGWGVELDKRTKGVAGAAERAPHAMVQELLNRTDDYLWAVVSNGQTLRLLRDSSSLSGQSYVEFDLAAMFDGEVFSDFAVMFLMLHRSRVEILSPDGPASDCWLERWRNASIESGTRALGLLRGGVQSALEVLGTGFLQHPANTDLRLRLEAMELSLQDYHRSLLRLVYRLLFLFVAEDRQALLAEDAQPVAKARYADYFSTARLRALSHKRRGTKHSDLWESLSLVIASLGDEQGCPELALPGIGGLFDHGPADVVTGQGLPNNALLAAIRNLSVVQPQGQPKRTVDYRNLGAEELGSIYESLLELVPRHDVTEQTFTLESLAGNERKTTGSYYTPTSLIELVLNEALDPLLEDAEKSENPAEALQALTICDPACGSGHFLVAAARRIADRLAVVRTGDVDPTPTDQQAAMYDVIANCIYGVDINPMAAELAKVSLWLEAIQPGRPLSFLDTHIRVGNSLIGTTPTLLKARIPDAAYGVIEGDAKKYAVALRNQNRLERDAGQSTLFGADEAVGVSNRSLRAQLAKVRTGTVKSLADIHELQRRYAAYLASPELARARLLADTWCSAFVQVQQPDSIAITDDSLMAIESGDASDDLMTQVRELAARYRFFHWHLEFPDVFDVPDGGATTATGWQDGFTAVLGNPPWERVKLQEQEFFASRDESIAHARNAAARKKLIAALPVTHPQLATEWSDAKRLAEGESHLLRNSGRYPLCGVGDVNTYSVFAEGMRSVTAPSGRMGVIVPTGIATDSTTQGFFRDIIARSSLVALFDFRNTGFFEGVASSQGVRFCVLVLSASPLKEKARIVFRARSIDEASRPDRTVMLEADDFSLLNPNTGTCPVFLSRLDADITLSIYRRHPVLIRENDPSGNPWGLHFLRMLDMATDSGLFRTNSDFDTDKARFGGWAWSEGSKTWVPLYEAKMLSHFNHRHGDYALAKRTPGKEVRALPTPPTSLLDDSEYEVIGRYWVLRDVVDDVLQGRWDRSWLFGWRNIATSLDVRTMIPAVFPRAGIGHAFPIALLTKPADVPMLQAVWSSFAFDYVTRQKHSGSNMTYGVLSQLACPSPMALDVTPGWATSSFREWLRPRILELVYTSAKMASYAVDVLALQDGVDPGAPFRWSPTRREMLRAEVDSAMFHLYGLSQTETAHVLDSFTVLRRYEERDHGEFRTKRLVLDIYDAMAEAAARGTAYRTILDPPPGEGPRHPARQAP
jgi:hypothetical protein